MPAFAHRNEKGFTLVEVMVSLVVLALGLLGSLVAVKAALDGNYGNDLRMEAVKIAQEQAEMARNMPYANIQGITSPQTVNRQIRKTNVGFTVNTQKTPANLSATNDITRLAIGVQWTFKKKTHTYSMETIVRQVK